MRVLSTSGDQLSNLVNNKTATPNSVHGNNTSERNQDRNFLHRTNATDSDYNFFSHSTTPRTNVNHVPSSAPPRKPIISDSSSSSSRQNSSHSAPNIHSACNRNTLRDSNDQAMMISDATSLPDTSASVGVSKTPNSPTLSRVPPRNLSMNSLNSHVIRSPAPVTMVRSSQRDSSVTNQSNSRWAKAAWILGLTGTQMNVS